MWAAGRQLINEAQVLDPESSSLRVIKCALCRASGNLQQSVCI